MRTTLNHRRGWRAAAGAAAVLAALAWSGASGLAQDEGPQGAGGKPGVEEDWPCVQKFVSELSWGAIWAEPDLTEALESWHDNTRLREIITLLSDDTTSEHDAIQAINEFADSLKTDKKKQLTELFAGLFETMSNQRTSAQAGIKRFYRRQERVAESLSAAGARLRDLDEEGVSHETEEYVDSQTLLAWYNRVYDERQRLVPYMCEVPVVIERRLGIYARAIQAQIEGQPMTPPAETASP